MIRENCSYRRLCGCSALFVSLLISLLLGITPVTVAAQDQLSESEQIIHVLNRLGYGPRPSDIEHVKAMGIPAYIEEQLFPETISTEAAVKQKAYRALLALRSKGRG